MNLPNGRACGVGPGRVLAQNVSHLGSDAVTLVELQAELLQADLRDWAKGFVKAVVLMAAALVIVLASLPVLLMSLGYFIDQMSELSLAASMLIAGGVGLLVAAIAAGLGVWMLKREQGILHNFTTELKKNISWLKQILSNPSHADTAAAGLRREAAAR